MTVLFWAEKKRHSNKNAPHIKVSVKPFQSPWSPPQRRNPPAHSNEQSKIKRRKAKVKKSKSARQPKNVKPRKLTEITIYIKQLICIALILYY